MPKVYLMCGKICGGKTTHSEQLRKQHKAVVLSVDEITLALFGQDAGEKLDEYVEKAEQYLFQKSLDIIETGTNVILDWGFWTRRERDYAKQFYTAHNISYEFHYIDISDEEWHCRLEKRNQAVIEHKTAAYYVDEGLAEKFKALFEIPTRDEIQVWIEQ